MSNPYAQAENTQQQQPFLAGQQQPPYQNNQGQYAPPPPNPNQGFNPQQQQQYPQNQGFQQPNYPAQNQGFNPNQPPNQQVVVINRHQGFVPGSRLMCPVCRRDTDSFPKKVAGGVTWIWCVVLFILTGIFCCWVPFCVDSCQDTQLVCVVCQTTKGRIEANCC